MPWAGDLAVIDQHDSHRALAKFSRFNQGPHRCRISSAGAAPLAPVAGARSSAPGGSQLVMFIHARLRRVVGRPLRPSRRMPARSSTKAGRQQPVSPL